MAEERQVGLSQPRRSARTPAKKPAKMPITAIALESPVQGKRKPRDTDKSPAEVLEYLLTNSRSKLTFIDLSNLINYNNFLELSEESQLRLCGLLPHTAFSTYIPTVCDTHPDLQPQPSNQMDIDRTPATLNPTVFTSSFFLPAQHTWQDHLFSSWLTKKAADELEEFTRGAKDGTLHADWKDEAWERDHSAQPRPKTLKKTVPSLDLAALAKNGLLQAGDVLAYKRSFNGLDTIVEKDLLIDAVDPQSHSISFLFSPGTEPALPPSLLAFGEREYDGKLLSMDDISDPVALERGILDVDGRVNSSAKFAHDTAMCTTPYTSTGTPSDGLKNLVAVRSWKAFTVWRMSDEVHEEQSGRERGGREKVATLFYLRGTL